MVGIIFAPQSIKKKIVLLYILGSKDNIIFAAFVIYYYTTLFYITPLHPVGFEPTAVNLEGCCSIHLS